MQWRFFSLMTSASVFLTVVTFIVGVYCRINFGKGLRRHCKLSINDSSVKLLNVPFWNPVEAREVLQDEEYEKGDTEKVSFPSSDAPIPTFSAAFGSGPEVPPPALMSFAPRFTGGPRFYGPANVDPNTAIAYGITPYTTPYTRSPLSSVYSAPEEKGLSRSESGSSQHSTSSHSSESSSGHTSDTSHSSRSKRWIIE